MIRAKKIDLFKNLTLQGFFRSAGLIAIFLFAVWILISSVSTVASAKGPIVLKLNEMSGTMGTGWPALVSFKEGVERRTNGLVEVKLYPNQGLFKAFQALTGLEKGMGDISVVNPFYTPNEMPLEILETSRPFNYPDMPTAIDASYKYWTSPFMENYMAKTHNLKVLWTVPRGEFHIYTRRELVRTMEDLKGLKIRSAGGMFTKMLHALGATPVAIGIMDVYSAVSRGIVDGVHLTTSCLKEFKLVEHINCLTVGNTGVNVSLFPISLRSFNKLPKEFQDIVVKEGYKTHILYGNAFYRDSLEGVELLKAKAGSQIYTLPPEELARWKKATISVTEEWIKDTEAKGLPAREAIELFDRLLKEATGK